MNEHATGRGASLRGIEQHAPLRGTWLRRRGQGEPVVMIHGFGGDHNSWRILVGTAALPRPVLAIDLPGHGLSPPGATRFEPIVDAVAEAIAHEGVGVAHLVGHSLGAAVAAGVAHAGRLSVSSLFLLSPAGLGPEINGAFLAGFCEARNEMALAPWLSMLVVRPEMIPPLFVEVTAQARAQPGVAEGQRRMAEGLFPEGRQSFSIRPLLSRTDLLTSIVFGEADRIIPSTHLEGLVGSITRHILPGVGHMPQIEAVDRVAALLLAHLVSIG